MGDTIAISYYESPIGLIQIKSVNHKVCSVLFVEKEADITTAETVVQKECVKQLKEYFAGTRFQFELPVYQMGTHFQQQVWNEVSKIGYGATLTYGQLAYKIGEIKRVRAVGTTNGKNKLAVIVPCHRVISAKRDLTGYAWELWRKEWLLKHEIEYGGLIEERLF